MSNKCKWEDGKFVACDDFTPEIMVTSSGSLPYCSSCNKTYKKPDPAVIIKQSGGTWVARYDGVDYLWMKQGMELVPKFKEKNWDWVPIESLTITDDIAKLRPLVVHIVNNAATKLFGVDDDKKLVTVRGWFGDLDGFRLATAGDLS